MPPKRTAASAGSGIERLYFEHYKTHVAKSGPKTAVLLQVGGFFEMYDYVDKATGTSQANVQTIAEVCGCVVEPRESGDPASIRLFWGFPEHSLPKYERLLVAEGYTVAVYVQVKDATGSVKERVLDHVSSPGTFWDSSDGLAIRRDEQIMLSIYIEPYTDMRKRQAHWYVASSAFDVMTGRSVSTETDLTLVDNKPVTDTLRPFWEMYPPAEVVCFWVASSPPPTKDDVYALIGGHHVHYPIHIQTLDPKIEAQTETDRIRRTMLETIYKPATSLTVDEFLGTNYYHYVRRSLYQLLQFIKDHNPSNLARLHEHTIWTADTNVVLGNAALSQLSMLPTHSDRPTECLLHWLQKAITPMGRRMLRERCLTPIADIEELDARQARIAALQALAPEVQQQFERTLKSMYDIERLCRRFQLGKGTTDDVLLLLQTYMKADELFALCKSANVYAPSAAIHTHIQSFVRVWDEARLRANKSQVDAPVAVGSYHPWARGQFPALDTLEDTWRALERSMADLRHTMETAVDEVGIVNWTLKEEAPFTFTTTSRRAQGIAAAMKRRHKMDVSSTTRGSASVCVLTCAPIDAANTEGIRLRADWRAAVCAQWTAWWSSWMDTEIRNGMLDALVEWISTLDAEFALARVATMYGYVRPRYIESTDDAEAGVYIEHMRHPIIERVHTSVPYVPHSVTLGALSGAADAETDVASSPCGLLVYGVNAAGKSSLGKALGLSVLMAQCGIPVPATAMKLIPYTSLYTRILGNDNLWAGMSSFVVEMTEFRSILRAAGSRTLVIGDELCAGTETASATSIVAAGIQTLVNRSTHFMLATHLHELASIDELASDARIQFYHLTVKSNGSGALVYDRKLHKGCGSPMYGLEVCRGLDMDPTFLATAVALRKRLYSDDGTARTSRYNASVVVQKCQVCGSSDRLETHHIVPQASADAAGRIAPGVHKNTSSNLVVLCEACHDAHHSNMLDIRGWITTSTGRTLDYVAAAKPHPLPKN